MTDFAALLQPDRGEAARAVAIIDKARLDIWLKDQPARVRAALTAQRFTGAAHEIAILPGEAADDWSVAAGVANAAALTPWCLARAAERLPEGQYRLTTDDTGAAALGWLLAQYRFDRYRKPVDVAGPRVLLVKDVARIDDKIRLAGAVAWVRDLVNTPASDLGPAALEAAAADLARHTGATIRVARDGDLENGFPLVAAVGRAAPPDRAPRLIELEWGEAAHPRIAIIGKGVCFDTGGLDIKPSSAMLLMKKDMGGAAHALALARLVIETRLPVRLHLLIPAVENSVSGDAFRPGDILASRKGLNVEIGNTDAEGRLILADALTRASEDTPELIIDFATLTGAARVALGPALPALFANDDRLAADFSAAAELSADPVWRLPLWDDYADMLKSDTADINNAGEGGMAGAVTAALFLKRFVPDDIPWAHLDTYAWMPAAKPGRPKGGEALGLRAAWALLKSRYPV